MESLLVHSMSKNLGGGGVFKDGADLRMEGFSCKQSVHTFSPGANGFTFFENLPFDVGVDVFVFEFPNVIAKCC